MADRNYHTFYSTEDLWEDPNPNYNVAHQQTAANSGRLSERVFKELIDLDQDTPVVIAFLRPEDPTTFRSDFDPASTGTIMATYNEPRWSSPGTKKTVSFLWFSTTTVSHALPIPFVSPQMPA